jgi:hypothetical protein
MEGTTPQQKAELWERWKNGQCVASSSSSGTKPLPPHLGHCCSSSVPFSMTHHRCTLDRFSRVPPCGDLREPTPPTQRNAPGKHRQLSDVGRRRYEIEDGRCQEQSRHHADRLECRLLIG